MASSSSSSLPASATASSQSCISQVFLSFRGEDTRKTFVDHLYETLQDRKVITYKDDEKLPRGESIRSALFSAISASQTAVVIFSKNYADSSWCLDELAYIMKCKDKRGLIVMPIFYDVVPSEVRKQEGDFGKGFAKLDMKNSNKVVSWRKALVDASNISGWEVKKTADGHEAKVIKEIADAILKNLCSVSSSVDKNLVGMSGRLQQLEKQLGIGLGGVSMVGVWGLGGIGKTTLASSLYMKVRDSHNFQGQCFIENVRENSSKQGGLKSLQENLLSTLLKTNIKLQSVVEGKHMIRSRLDHSKVLVVLDDVDNLTQLEALVGSHDWFGSGSRIIITTRDEHLLRTHKIDLVCPVTLLSDEEAAMLFNKHAHNKINPVNDYETLSSRVVSYAAGLPLALKVLGSFLYDKNEKEWLSCLSRLKHIPEKDIVEVLKISYDGLIPVEKELFLDIACFSRGEKIKVDYRHSQNPDDPMEVFEACGFHPDIGIKVLEQRALITIVFDRFEMHDLVQEMGHYIVRGEHSNCPEKHTRVWKNEEIKNMCLGDATRENDKIEAIKYKPPPWGDDDYNPSLLCKIVSNMKKLRFLSLDTQSTNSQNVEGPDSLSNELRYIRWNGYPESPFPDSFQPMKLVVLKLDGSLLWRDDKHLPHLKVLELSLMKNLVSTPNFDRLPSLQKLTLIDCSNLLEIHPSLGKHTSLEYVNVSWCDKLRMFPTVVNMRNLKTLKIKYCLITESPSVIGELSNLQELDLCGNHFTRLDFSLSQLTRLKLLNLTGCGNLVELPKLPSGLVVLNADECYSLTTRGDVYTDCKWLSKVSFAWGGVINDGNRLLQIMIEENALQNHFKVLAVEGREIAKGFRPRLVRGRDRVRLELPENWSNDYSGFLMCVVGGVGVFISSQLITMEEVVSGMDYEDDVAEWEESYGDKKTVVWYVPLASLRNTLWWNSPHKEIFFTWGPKDIYFKKSVSGFGVKLVGKRKSETCPLETLTTQEEESENSNYAPKFLIKEDSLSALSVELPTTEY